MTQYLSRQIHRQSDFLANLAKPVQAAPPVPACHIVSPHGDIIAITLIKTVAVFGIIAVYHLTKIV